MTTHPLANPIWHSLTSRHASFAQRHGDIARYPAPVAPFLGVAHTGVDAAAACAALVAATDTVLLLGVAPVTPAGWELKHLAMLAQMVCEQPLPVVDGAEIIELTQQHRADILALTALVYPHYFRSRTPELGRYFGIYHPNPSGDMQLAAMIGERMGTNEWTEISAVCTHPDFNGRGHARRLLAFLSNDVLAQGRRPFLHVSHENVRAKELYLHNGYDLRCDIPFWSLRRATP
jgi:predicted GNAT family acetyltransferase